MAANIIEKLRTGGCDTAEAMERFIGSEEMYIRFLKRFLTDLSFEQIKPYIDEGKYDEAFKSVHTLKGVSGNLGLTPIFTIACEMVDEYRAEQPEEAWLHYDELASAYKNIVAIING